MSVVLSASKLSKSFGSTRALDGVSLDIAGGEVVALMGANGAGKSTLVKILAGIHRSDSGTVTILGKSVTFSSPRQARAEGIVTVHQSVADVGVLTLSVADNLLLDSYCASNGALFVGGRAQRMQAQEMAGLVGLDVDLDARLDSLSIADRQLVAIASAVAHKPVLLIFDEPTASLSGRESDRLFSVIDRLKARGVAILYISHKISDLRRIADRVVVIRDGKLSGSFTQPLDFPAAIRAMIGRDIGKQAQFTAKTGLERILKVNGARLKDTSEPFDFEAYAGEVVAVTGPVGAGKTTFAGALFGLWRFADGALELNGKSWKPTSPGSSIERGVFLAGEDRWRTTFFPQTVPFADIAGTISFPFLRRWSVASFVSRGFEVRAAEKLIGNFGIKARGADDSPGALSGGNQQKVVLARWHAEPARLLLLDEPFQGVDIGARNDIIRAIREKSADRATIVFVNDLEEALEVADRVVVMVDHTIAPVCDSGLDEAAALLAAAGDTSAPAIQQGIS